MNNINLMLGDCLERLRELPDNSVDAVVTDPPYGLSFMGKKWDYDVPSVEIWAECLRVLKPGGHLLAFAGTRTQHRMAVRIEDAGFEIRDMIAWVYGSGFPKSLDVSKAIDKAAGAERTERLLPKNGHENFVGKDNLKGLRDGTVGQNEGGYDRPWMHDPQKVEDSHWNFSPATEAAQQWQGWGTALKPALEPITVARKPLIGTVAENVLAHGTGAINVDGCRVGTEDMSAQWDRSWADNSGELGQRYPQSGRESGKTVPPGRWPANLIHDGSQEVVDLFPETGPSMGRDSRGRNHQAFTDDARKSIRDDVHPGYGDSGSAARFFYCAKNSEKDQGEGDAHPTVRPALEPITVARKPLIGTVAENVLAHGTGAINVDGCRVETDVPRDWRETRRNDDSDEARNAYGKGLAGSMKVEPTMQGRWPANLIHDGSQEVVDLFPETSPSPSSPVKQGGKKSVGGIMNATGQKRDGFGVGYGDIGSSARFFYCAKTAKKDRGEGNAHPTVKPTDLMRYLCRLVTQPGGTVLDPFMGSGSTGKAAMMEGFDFIGVERDEAYFEIAKARIEAVKLDMDWQNAFS